MLGYTLGPKLHGSLFVKSGAFVPPVTPPVTGQNDRLASRQVITVAGGAPPYNPANNTTFNNWYDLSVNADVLGGGSPTYRTNILNATLPAVVFGGATYLTSNNNFPTGGTWTVQWIGKLNAQDGAGQAIWATGTVGGALGSAFALREVGGQYSFLDADGTTSYGSASSDLNWHNFTVAYDGSTLRMWIDNNLVIVVAVSLAPPPQSFYLAAFLGATLDNAQMSIFEMNVYPFAFSIAQLNSQGTWYSGTGTGAPNTGLSWSNYSFAPNYYPGLVGDYDGDHAGAGAIVSWPDQSGNGHTLTGTGTVVAGPNGHNAVQINGIADKWTAASSIITEPATLYIVYDPISLPTYGAMAANYSAAAFNGFAYYLMGSGKTAFYYSNGGVTQSHYDPGTITVATGTYGFFIAPWDTSGGTTSVDGSADGAFGALSNNSPGHFTLGYDGVNQFSNGNYARVLVYNSKHNSATQAAILAYLQGLY